MKKLLACLLLLIICFVFIAPTAALYFEQDSLNNAHVAARTYSFNLTEQTGSSFTASVSPQNNTFVFSFFV